ncbi:MAG TPA: VTT domain-containing protein [Leptospiraceae bacterium]|nr:VTT domain-containing protein [Leptospiraceae bacterium]HMW04831.1 VTT domain-containing protein [Leptospiraceae bacterium]HMX34760.1 VTT domain-containing protein [Leptospiraceae bacterium]HMY30421.1 VTT domain-containing protein [Leptospiraceae bacterium]HMZ64655.1 VTT domain-containing protein [Leptospiraceae bacterium]
MDKDLRKLIIQSVIGIVLIIALVILLAHIVKGPITQFSKLFVDYLGVWGVGLGILVSDSLPAFMVPDAFLVFAVAGKLGDFEVILFCSIGSLIGGSNSYAIGRYLIPRFESGRNLIKKHEAKLLPYIEKYGMLAVVIAATTPLPYSWMSILVGSFKMSFSKFLLCSLTRIPRFAVYYYAIKFGWVEDIVFFLSQIYFT